MYVLISFCCLQNQVTVATIPTVPGFVCGVLDANLPTCQGADDINGIERDGETCSGYERVDCVRCGIAPYQNCKCNLNQYLQYYEPDTSEGYEDPLCSCYWHKNVGNGWHGECGYLCTNCPAGKQQQSECYRRFSSDGICVACGTGQGSAAGGTCYTCPAGKKSVANSDCVACEAGKKQAAEGQSKCDPCPAGQYMASTGATACTPCACGFYDADSRIGCNWCPAGKYNPDEGQEDSTDCNECPIGYTTPGAVQGECGNSGGTTPVTWCNICPAGTYSTETGLESGECTKCEAGKQDVRLNLVTATRSKCDDCPKDFWNSGKRAGGGQACEECGKGYVTNDLTGSSTCTQCNTDMKYEKVEGSSRNTCENCMSGYEAKPAPNNWGIDMAAGCDRCVHGTYSFLSDGSRPTTAGCVACEEGKFTALDRDYPVRNPPESPILHKECFSCNNPGKFINYVVDPVVYSLPTNFADNNDPLFLYYSGSTPPKQFAAGKDIVYSAIAEADRAFNQNPAKTPLGSGYFDVEGCRTCSIYYSMDNPVSNTGEFVKTDFQVQHTFADGQTVWMTVDQVYRDASPASKAVTFTNDISSATSICITCPEHQELKRRTYDEYDPLTLYYSNPAVFDPCTDCPEGSSREYTSKNASARFIACQCVRPLVRGNECMRDYLEEIGTIEDGQEITDTCFYNPADALSDGDPNCERQGWFLEKFEGCLISSGCMACPLAGGITPQVSYPDTSQDPVEPTETCRRCPLGSFSLRKRDTREVKCFACPEGKYEPPSEFGRGEDLEDGEDFPTDLTVFANLNTFCYECQAGTFFDTSIDWGLMPDGTTPGGAYNDFQNPCTYRSDGGQPCPCHICPINTFLATPGNSGNPSDETNPCRGCSKGTSKRLDSYMWAYETDAKYTAQGHEDIIPTHLTGDVSCEPCQGIETTKYSTTQQDPHGCDRDDRCLSSSGSVKQRIINEEHSKLDCKACGSVDFDELEHVFLWQYDATYKAGVCTNCPSGQFMAENNLGCSDCPEYLYRANSEDMFYSDVIACKKPNEGYEATPVPDGVSYGPTTQRPCGSGFYSHHQMSQVKCTECPKGKFTSGTGSSECTSCRDYNKPGSGFIGGEVQKNYRAYQTTTGQSSCDVCPDFSFACHYPVNGEKTPFGEEACPDEDVQTRSDLDVNCIVCDTDVGEFYNTGTEAKGGGTCGTCTRHQYSANGVCKDCPAGKYKVSATSQTCVSCLPCPDGYYMHHDSECQDVFNCKKCPSCLSPNEVRVGCMNNPGNLMAIGDCFPREIVQRTAVCPTKDAITSDKDDRFGDQLNEDTLKTSSSQASFGLGGFGFSEVFGSSYTSVDFQCRRICDGTNQFVEKETSDANPTISHGVSDGGQCSGPFACNVQACTMESSDKSLDLTYRMPQACPVEDPVYDNTVDRYSLNKFDSIRNAPCQSCEECGQNAIPGLDWGRGCAKECSRLVCQENEIFDWTRDKQPLSDACTSCALLRDSRLCSQESQRFIGFSERNISGIIPRIYLHNCRPKLGVMETGGAEIDDIGNEILHPNYGDCVICPQFDGFCGSSEFLYGCSQAGILATIQPICKMCSVVEGLSLVQSYYRSAVTDTLHRMFCQATICPGGVTGLTEESACHEVCFESSCSASQFHIPCALPHNSRCFTRTPLYNDERTVVGETPAHINLIEKKYKNPPQLYGSFENLLLDTLTRNYQCVWNAKISDNRMDPGGLSNNFFDPECNQLSEEEGEISYEMLPLQNTVLIDGDENFYRRFRTNTNAYAVKLTDADFGHIALKLDVGNKKSVAISTAIPRDDIDWNAVSSWLPLLEIRARSKDSTGVALMNIELNNENFNVLEYYQFFVKIRDSVNNPYSMSSASSTCTSGIQKKELSIYHKKSSGLESVKIFYQNCDSLNECVYFGNQDYITNTWSSLAKAVTDNFNLQEITSLDLGFIRSNTGDEQQVPVAELKQSHDDSCMAYINSEMSIYCLERVNGNLNKLTLLFPYHKDHFEQDIAGTTLNLFFPIYLEDEFGMDCAICTYFFIVYEDHTTLMQRHFLYKKSTQQVTVMTSLNSRVLALSGTGNILYALTKDSENFFTISRCTFIDTSGTMTIYRKLLNHVIDSNVFSRHIILEFKNQNMVLLIPKTENTLQLYRLNQDLDVSVQKEINIVSPEIKQKHLSAASRFLLRDGSLIFAYFKKIFLLTTTNDIKSFFQEEFSSSLFVGHHNSILTFKTIDKNREAFFHETCAPNFDEDIINNGYSIYEFNNKHFCSRLCFEIEESNAYTSFLTNCLGYALLSDKCQILYSSSSTTAKKTYCKLKNDIGSAARISAFHSEDPINTISVIGHSLVKILLVVQAPLYEKNIIQEQTVTFEATQLFMGNIDSSWVTVTCSSKGAYYIAEKDTLVSEDDSTWAGLSNNILRTYGNDNILYVAEIYQSNKIYESDNTIQDFYTSITMPGGRTEFYYIKLKINCRAIEVSPALVQYGYTFASDKEVITCLDSQNEYETVVLWVQECSRSSQTCHRSVIWQNTVKRKQSFMTVNYFELFLSPRSQIVSMKFMSYNDFIVRPTVETVMHMTWSEYSHTEQLTTQWKEINVRVSPLLLANTVNLIFNYSYPGISQEKREVYLDAVSIIPVISLPTSRSIPELCQVGSTPEIIENFNLAFGSQGFCTECVAGKFASSAQFVTCMECPAGKYQDLTGQSICVNCVEGKFSNTVGSVQSSDCIECGAGKYANTTGQSECWSCPPGYQVPVAHRDADPSSPLITMQDACEICNRSEYSHIDTHTGTRTLDLQMCVRCPHGKWSFEPSDECIGCPIGTYSNASVGFVLPEDESIEGSMCVRCLPGKYGPMTGASDCIECPENTFQPGYGMEFIEDCLPCSSTTRSFSAPGNSNQSLCVCGNGSYGIYGRCKACPPHSTSSYGAQQSIDCYCEAGFYVTNDPQRPCMPCSMGKYSNENQVACTDCDEGFYNDRDGASSCKNCPPGQSSLPGMTFCVDSLCTGCPVGTYEDVCGATSVNDCSVCKPGTFSSGPSQYCETCPPGRYNNQTGASSHTSCLDCPAGKYNTDYGRTLCEDCPKNTYLSSLGAQRGDQCVLCPRNTFASSGATECVSCADGEFSDPGGDCMPCIGPCECDAGYNRHSKLGSLPGGISWGLFNHTTSTIRILKSTQLTMSWTEMCPDDSEIGSGGADVPGFNTKWTFEKTDLNCVSNTGSAFGVYLAQGDQLDGSLAGGGLQLYLYFNKAEISGEQDVPGWFITINQDGVLTDPLDASTAVVGPCVEHSKPFGATNAMRTYAWSPQINTIPNGIDGQHDKTSWMWYCNSGSLGELSSFTPVTTEFSHTFDDWSLCVPCQAGKFSASTSYVTAACSRCPSGTFSASEAATTCTECQPGSFSQVRTQTTGASTCSSCLAGKFSAQSGQSVCIMCQEDTYSSAGASTCVSCPVGLVSPAGSDSKDDCLYSRNMRRLEILVKIPSTNNLQSIGLDRDLLNGSGISPMQGDNTVDWEKLHVAVTLGSQVTTHRNCQYRIYIARIDASKVVHTDGRLFELGCTLALNDMYAKCYMEIPTAIMSIENLAVIQAVSLNDHERCEWPENFYVSLEPHTSIYQCPETQFWSETLKRCESCELEITESLNLDSICGLGQYIKGCDVLAGYQARCGDCPKPDEWTDTAYAWDDRLGALTCSFVCKAGYWFDGSLCHACTTGLTCSNNGDFPAGYKLQECSSLSDLTCVECPSPASGIYRANEIFVYGDEECTTDCIVGQYYRSQADAPCLPCKTMTELRAQLEFERQSDGIFYKFHACGSNYDSYFEECGATVEGGVYIGDAPSFDSNCLYDCQISKIQINNSCVSCLQNFSTEIAFYYQYSYSETRQVTYNEMVGHIEIGLYTGITNLKWPGSTHPIRISKSSGWHEPESRSDDYEGAVVGSSGTILTIPDDYTEQLFYYCGNHETMYGEITYSRKFHPSLETVQNYIISSTTVNNYAYQFTDNKCGYSCNNSMGFYKTNHINPNEHNYFMPCVYCGQCEVGLYSALEQDDEGRDVCLCKACSKTQTSENWVFSSAGSGIGDEYSCEMECGPSYYQDFSRCRPHSAPVCTENEFLVPGSPLLDTTCQRCRTCTGQRLIEPCSETTDTRCESCPELPANQKYTGTACNITCAHGYQANTRNGECELCGHFRCPYGSYKPAVMDNCTHCEACIPSAPRNAEYYDTFCQWTCPLGWVHRGDECVEERQSPFSLRRSTGYGCTPLSCSYGFIPVPRVRACSVCMPCADTNVMTPDPTNENVTWVWKESSTCEVECKRGFFRLRRGTMVECLTESEYEEKLNVRVIVGDFQNSTTNSWQAPQNLRLAKPASETSFSLTIVLVFVFAALGLSGVIICT